MLMLTVHFPAITPRAPDSKVSWTLQVGDDAGVCGVEHGNDAGELSAGVGEVSMAAGYANTECRGVIRQCETLWKEVTISSTALRQG